MSLALLARFHTQSEAQVAASALRSAGLAAVVFDEHYGGLDWVQQSALGGYRLMLPAQELEDGRAIVAEAARMVPEPEDSSANPPGSGLATLATIAAALVAGAEGGWLVSGAKRRVWPKSGSAVVLGSLLTVVLFLAGGLAIVWLAKLLLDPP